MSIKKLSLTDTLDSDKYKGKTIEQILDTDKRRMFKLLKLGYDFDDEVLEKYRFKRTIRDVKFVHEFVDKTPQPTSKKTLTKDTVENARKLMKSLATLDNDKSYYNVEEATEETGDEYEA